MLDTAGYSHLQRTHHTTQLCPAEKVMVPGGMSLWGNAFQKRHGCSIARGGEVVGDMRVNSKGRDGKGEVTPGATTDIPL